MAVAVARGEVDYTIKPEAVAPSISTSEWPLLLKNYEKRMFVLPNLGLFFLFFIFYFFF